VSDRIAAGDPSWPDELVQLFSSAVGADTVGFVAGLERGLMGYSVNTGGPPLSMDERTIWASHWAEYPSFADLMHGGVGAALRTSDRISSMAEFRRTVIYAEHFAPRDARHQASFCLVVDGHIAMTGLCRKSHDFSVDEIEALERARVLLVRTLKYRATVDAVEHLAAVAADPGHHVLTPRQEAVLAFVAAGATDRSISRRLGISERTVRKHVGDIRARLQVTSRVTAAHWWWKRKQVRSRKAAEEQIWGSPAQLDEPDRP